MIDLLRLRHRLILRERHRRVLPSPADPLAADAWDLRSHHFGLYRVGPDGETAVGYQRGVCGEPTRTGLLVAAAATRVVPAAATLPLLLTFQGQSRDAVCSFVQSALATGSRLMEGTFAVIEPRERGVRAARFHLDATLAAYLFHLRFDLGVAGVARHHERAYLRMGFRRIAGGDSCRADQSAVALGVRPGNVAGDTRARVERYAAQLDESGRCRLTVPAPLEMAA
jgi:hypothetical protein